MNDPANPPKTAQIGRHRRLAYNLLGWLCFGLGLAGMFLPLMPTTVFWICAAWLWLRSSPHRVRFLLEHPNFGRSIRRFLEHGEICRNGKTAAMAGMGGSLVIWYVLIQPAWSMVLLVAGILSLVAVWIATRPEGERKPPETVAVTLDPNAWTPNRPSQKSLRPPSG